MAEKSQMGECDMNGHYVEFVPHHVIVIPHSLLLFSR